MARPDYTEIQPDGYLDPHQAAARIGVTPHTITAWARKGKFKDCKRVGRFWFFKVEEIKAMAKAYNNRLR